MNTTSLACLVVAALGSGCASTDLSVNRQLDQRSITSVAVLPPRVFLPRDFDELSGESRLAVEPVVTDLLVTHLSGALLDAGYSVVERGRLDEVFSELGLQQTDLVDPSTAARIGRVLGVHGVILSQLARDEDSSVFYMRMIHVESGAVAWTLTPQHGGVNFHQLSESLKSMLSRGGE